MGGFLDELCVFVGVIIIWFANGCKYSLSKAVKKAPYGTWFCSGEAIIGLVTILVIIGVLTALIHFFG